MILLGLDVFNMHIDDESSTILYKPIFRKTHKTNQKLRVLSFKKCFIIFGNRGSDW
jgi:hypothetical protein